METKKSDRTNLEKKRSVFFQVGLLVALSVAFVAFEWQVAPRVSNIETESPIFIDTDPVVVQTFPEIPPPPPSPPQLSMDLEIVEDDVIVDSDLVDVVWEGGENILLDSSFKPIEVEEDVEDVIFSPVEASALFNGKPAEEGFREYIRNNLDYPQIAIDNGITGTVFIQFVVDQKGNAVDVQVVRKADPSLENEAVRLIKSSSGMWTPGKQRNKPVKVRYTFPITFRLQ